MSDSSGDKRDVGVESVVTVERYVKNVPVKVQNMSISGNSRTASNYFDNEFRSSLSSKDLRTLHDRLHAACSRLQSTGVFKSADVSINVPSSKLESDVLPVSIDVRVQERKTPFLQVQYADIKIYVFAIELHAASNRSV